VLRIPPASSQERVDQAGRSEPHEESQLTEKEANQIGYPVSEQDRRGDRGGDEGARGPRGLGRVEEGRKRKERCSLGNEGCIYEAFGKEKQTGKGKGKGKGKELDGPECALECTIKIFSHHLDSWIAQHLAPGKRSA